MTQAQVLAGNLADSWRNAASMWIF